MHRESGFTLIELLVVVAVIGILAGIAIPQYGEYRERAFDSRSKSDLRNAISAQEALYADTESYAACSNSTCNSPTLPGFQLSDGVELEMTVAGDGLSFAGVTSHPLGNVAYNFDSDVGVINEGNGGATGGEGGSGIGG
ncbi:MAG: prepilin-type N-terminal cleavage/methylation domain-containing protein [Bdellovibrionales bacterium]|nr:prepilin-type N-terminal cleavage/methylation domain-containing protein [Bdellovibrionales bacterium]